MKKRLLLVMVIAVLGAGWYLFRPERLFVNQKVNESFPSQASAQTPAQPQKLLAGAFHDGAHKTMGNAEIFQLPDGKRVLRLTKFETSNGPDVHVYMVAASDAKDNDTVKSAGFVELGSMKGNMGDQNYDIPSNVDLAKYRAVTIWCQRFGVNFGTAPLS